MNCKVSRCLHYLCRKDLCCHLSFKQFLCVGDSLLLLKYYLFNREEGKDYSCWSWENSFREASRCRRISEEVEAGLFRHPTALLELPFLSCNHIALTEFDAYRYHVILRIFRLMEIHSSTCIISSDLCFRSFAELNFSKIYTNQSLVLDILFVI